MINYRKDMGQVHILSRYKIKQNARRLWPVSFLNINYDLFLFVRVLLYCLLKDLTIFLNGDII